MEGERTRRLAFVVDDRVVCLEPLTTHFQKRGLELIAVCDPQEAASSIFLFGARVVVVGLEDMANRGMELIRQVKLRDAGVQVIAIMSPDSMRDVLTASRIGADACIFRPMQDFADLEDSVDYCFRRIDCWWDCLHERLALRQKNTVLESVAATDSSLNKLDDRT